MVASRDRRVLSELVLARCSLAAVGAHLGSPSSEPIFGASSQ